MSSSAPETHGAVKPYRVEEIASLQKPAWTVSEMFLVNFYFSIPFILLRKILFSLTFISILFSF